MIQDTYSDPRFKFIGDMPSGCFVYDWKELYLRPFTVVELPLLSLGAHARYNGVTHLLRAVDIVISQNVRDLTDGDFEFVLGWLRKFSFPSTPLVVTYDCTNRIFTHPGGAVYLDEADPNPNVKKQRELKLKPTDCGTHNVEIVHNVRMQIDALDDDWVNNDPELDLPRMATYSDYYEDIFEHPENKLLGMLARYVKAGETYREKLAIIETDLDLYDRAYSMMSRSKHGIHEDMILRCRSCDNRVPYVAHPNYRTFFPESSEKEISDVQYNLMAKFHTQPNDNMPAMKLLYHHSCLVRDIKEEEQRRSTQRSANRGRR